MLTDGQTQRRTDTTKLIVTFRNFANSPKNLQIIIKKLTILFATLYRLNFCKKDIDLLNWHFKMTYIYIQDYGNKSH
jgi:hypothetical protein